MFRFLLCYLYLVGFEIVQSKCGVKFGANCWYFSANFSVHTAQIAPQFVMGKANRNNENIFKWSINRKSDRHNSAIKHHNSHKTVKNKYPNYSSYSIIPTSEVTQGAIEVWATLPDEIRQDPSLASFRQEHERIHGEFLIRTFSFAIRVIIRSAMIWSNTEFNFSFVWTST